MTSPTGPGTPLSLDLVADVHAGVYPPDETAHWRRLIAGDPAAQAMWAALEATADDLSLLPAQRMPSRYAQRLDDAIAAESDRRFGPVPGQVAPVIRLADRSPPGGGAEPPGAGPLTGARRLLDAARARRGFVGRFTIGLGLAAAAAAITVLALQSNSTSGLPNPTGAAPQAIVATPGHLADLAGQLVGRQTAGALSDPITAAACYAANAVVGTSVTAFRDVTYQGRTAVAIVVSVDATHERILVVGPTCGANGPDLLESQLVPK